MDPITFLLLVLAVPIGILVGLGASIIGLTAWPLVVPLFFMIGGFSLHEALLSSMCIDLVHGIILTIYYQQKPDVGVNVKYSIQLGLVASVVSVVTAIIVFQLLEQFSDLFKGGAGYITMILGSIFIFQALKRRNKSMKLEQASTLSNIEPKTSEHWYQNLSEYQKNIFVFGFVAIQGFITGLIAIGGAMNIALVLILLLGYPALRAGGTAMTSTTIMLSTLVLTYLILLNFTFNNWFIVMVYIFIGSASCIVGVMKAQRIGEWKLFLIIGSVVITSAVFAMLQIYLLG